MIRDYATATVKLNSIADNSEGKKALSKALSEYPLYKGKKNYDLIPTRQQLNKRILEAYKYREIGFETVGRFLDELRITMNDIMPYYNELFKTIETMADLENPFDNVDVTETIRETRKENVESEGSSNVEQDGNALTKVNASSETETNGSGNAKTTTKKSDTPQNNVSNINNYLSEYEENVNTNSFSNTENNSSDSAETVESENNTSTTLRGTSETETIFEHTMNKKGNQGVNTYAHDMNEFRTSIIDVVNRIVHDNRIAELFLLVW